MSLILGRVQTERPSLLSAALGLVNPLRGSQRACRDALAALRILRPEAPLVKMPPKNVNTVVFAPVGAGKSTGLVIPWLLICPDSAFVIDFKGELAAATARAREKMGHRVVLLDPYRIVTKSPDCYNPMSFIDRTSPTSIDDCRSLGEALVVRQGTEHEPHWNDSAEQWISAIIGLVAFDAADPRARNLLCVRSIFADPERLKAAIQCAGAIGDWDGIIGRWGAQMLHPAEKERGSICSTVNRNLSFCDSVPVTESLCDSSFDFGDLRRTKMTVYAVIPADKLRINTGLLRLWVSSMLRSVVRQGIGERRLVHCILDEAAALGKMDCLNELVDKYRGYGLRAQFYYQSQGQLNRCWPEDKGQTLLSNCSAIYFGVNDRATAEEVSNRLGAQTIALEGGSTQRGDSHSRPAGGFAKDQGSNSYSTNDSTSWQQSRRALLTPDEVMRLQRTAITFLPGLPPVMTTLLRHFEENFRPGLIRRFLGALRVLIASSVVFALTAALAMGLAAIERNPPSPAREAPQPAPAMTQPRSPFFVDEPREKAGKAKNPWRPVPTRQP